MLQSNRITTWSQQCYLSFLLISYRTSQSVLNPLHFPNCSLQHFIKINYLFKRSEGKKIVLHDHHGCKSQKLLADISVTVAQLHSTHMLQKYVWSSKIAPTLRTEFLPKITTTLMTVRKKTGDRKWKDKRSPVC